MMTNEHLTQAIDLIQTRLGLSATTLERVGLADLFSQMGVSDVASYVQSLRTSSETSDQWQRLIHALTIGETYFLRDKEHFRILREHILPRLILERRKTNDLHLTIWCAGCSTGEEPYSIATTLYEMLPDWENWQITIIGTDINQRALDIAQQGIYREWSFRDAPLHFRPRYFQQVDDGWKIIDVIRSKVLFKRMNILSGQPTVNVDIVFARHMLMYLNEEHASQAETIIYHALVDDGWLLLGQAEALRTQQNHWLLHSFPGKPIYQKQRDASSRKATITYPKRHDVVTTINNTTTTSDQHYTDAVTAFQQKQIAQAEHHLSSLLDENTNHPQGHTLLGAIFANRKIYPEALSHVELALDENGLLADAHYIKGLIQLEQNSSDTAIQSLSAAIYCNRQHGLAALMLGNLYQTRGDKIKAERHWRNARQAIQDKADDDFLADISDITVARFRAMIPSDDTTR